MPESLERPRLGGPLARHPQLSGLTHCSQDLPLLLLLREPRSGVRALLTLLLIDVGRAHRKRAVLDQELTRSAQTRRNSSSEQTARGANHPVDPTPEEPLEVTAWGASGGHLAQEVDPRTAVPAIALLP